MKFLKSKKMLLALIVPSLILGATQVQAKDSELIDELKNIDQTGEEVLYQDASITSIEAFATNMVTSGLRATGSGKERVTLTWDKVSGADGYLIYGQKTGKYGYVGMTTQGTTFNDTKALATDYNYYWVFPYTKDNAGNMIVGSCPTYKYAKGICASVTNLKSATINGGNSISWTASYGADGYLVYGIRPGESYNYIGMTTGATTYIDYKAAVSGYTYYWVYPYFKAEDTSMIAGLTSGYTYGRALPATIDGVKFSTADVVAEVEMLEYLNQIREEQGLHALQFSNSFYDATVIRARELTILFSHSRPNGDSWIDLAEGLGAENVCYSYVTSGTNAVNQFYASDAHRGNMMSAYYTKFACKRVISNGRAYWVQLFGA